MDKTGGSGCEYMKCEYFVSDTGGERCTYPHEICRYRREFSDADEVARLKGEVEEARAQNKELRAELDKWAKSVFARDLAACRKELDAEKGKVKTVVAYAEDVLIGSDHDYAGKRIIEILTGEG